MEFNVAYSKLYEQIGLSKKMVLSTSLNDAVTSRMMSIIILNKKLYFQTDITFRKYNQIKGNARVALCNDNIQIEGYCEEIGIPMEQEAFSNAYEKYFLSSYQRYTSLKNERLFVVSPTYVKRWLYIDGIPYIEVFDVTKKQYDLTKYIGE